MGGVLAKLRDLVIMGNVQLTYYDVLGVPQYAADKEIKAAYYRLSKKYHPDKNPSPNAAARYKKINEAYDVLVKSKNAMYYEAVDPAVVEENLKMAEEVRTQQRTAKDELEELQKKNAFFDDFFSCVKCKADISGVDGIRFGCGHNSCETCSEESEICHRCKKEIQKRRPL